MTKLLIIGIDGMDREFIKNNINLLPNLREIILNNPNINSTSVFPPDSDTAWASIYTGLNPAKHGVVDFVDPLERQKLNKKESEYLDVKAIKGKTFWDIAGKAGKKVCIIYPHIAFPVWPVNGFMINPNPETEELQIYPPDFQFNFNVKKLKFQKRIPRSKFEFRKYLNKKRDVVINEFDFSTKMIINYDWDLFFFYSSALDSIQHIFWSYCDPNDPTYPGDNSFKDAIKNSYILYDKLIGDMLKNIDSNTTVLIFSDHGHSMRPVNLININEILRKEGYLYPKDNQFPTINNFKERLKRGIVNIAQKSGLRPAAQTFLRMFPSVKNMYTNPSAIDFDKTSAHCTDMSGLKSYTYGGIMIDPTKFTNAVAFKKAKSHIINILSNIKIPNSNENVIQWICEREKIYSGKFITKYPEIVFNLHEGYGAGWDINLPLFTKSNSHKFYPGSHRGSTPIFYILNSGNKHIDKSIINLMQIAPTILDLLDINWKDLGFDGKSLL